MTELARQNVAETMEQVVMGGDLGRLDAAGRMAYYQATCKSLGLNPLTRPFDYITLNGKLTLYAKKDAADQLRKINGVSIERPEITFQDDLIIVNVSGYDQTGRRDSEIGVVKKGDMRGDMANSLMKAVTKAKRRLTLSICGLGFLDETEVETIPDAQLEPPVPPAPPAPAPAATHWIDRSDVRAKFWAWATDLGLTDAQVHEALGCASVKHYTGTMVDAKTQIESWVNQQAT